MKKKREIKRHKRIKEMSSRRLDETTVGFRVYVVPGKRVKPKKFTLVHPLRMPGERARFIVRNDSTGKYVFESFKRSAAEAKQRELMAA